MSLFDDLKTKADLNGDGKPSMQDITDMKDKISPEQWKKLKEIGDRNGDGKIDMADLKDFDAGDMVNDIKSNLGGLFGGK